jgi:multicomponent Na+:H+ antiporter subunit E
MRRFGFNLILGIVWCLLYGSFTSWNFIAGILIGALVITVFSRVVGAPPYIGKLWRLCRFTGYFFWILVKSNLEIAREVVTPGFTQQPRIIRYPVDHLTDVQKTTLANAISLTPGTLAVDISPDGAFLYLHCMYAEDRTAQIAEIDALADRLERWVFT